MAFYSILFRLRFSPGLEQMVLHQLVNLQHYLDVVNLDKTTVWIAS